MQKRNIKGGTTALVVMCTIVIIMIGIGFFLLSQILGGGHELQNAVDSGTLNIARDAIMTPAITLDANDPVQAQFVGVADKNNNISLNSINRVFGQALIVQANAKAMTQEGSSTATTISDAQSVTQAANSIGTKLTNKLQDQAELKNSFETMSNFNSIRMLLAGAKKGSKDISMTDFQTAYYNSNSVANIAFNYADSPNDNSTPLQLPTSVADVYKTQKAAWTTPVSQVANADYLKGYTGGINFLGTGNADNITFVPLKDKDNFLGSQAHTISRSQFESSKKAPTANAVPNCFLASGQSLEHTSKTNLTLASCALAASRSNTYADGTQSQPGVADNAGYRVCIPGGFIRIKNASCNVPPPSVTSTGTVGQDWLSMLRSKGGIWVTPLDVWGIESLTWMPNPGHAPTPGGPFFTDTWQAIWALGAENMTMRGNGTMGWGGGKSMGDGTTWMMYGDWAGHNTLPAGTTPETLPSPDKSVYDQAWSMMEPKPTYDQVQNIGMPQYWGGHKSDYPSQMEGPITADNVFSQFPQYIPYLKSLYGTGEPAGLNLDPNNPCPHAVELANLQLLSERSQASDNSSAQFLVQGSMNGVSQTGEGWMSGILPLPDNGRQPLNTSKYTISEINHHPSASQIITNAICPNVVTQIIQRCYEIAPGFNSAKLTDPDAILALIKGWNDSSVSLDIGQTLYIYSDGKQLVLGKTLPANLAQLTTAGVDGQANAYDLNTKAVGGESGDNNLLVNVPNDWGYVGPFTFASFEGSEASPQAHFCQRDFYTFTPSTGYQGLLGEVSLQACLGDESCINKGGSKTNKTASTIPKFTCTGSTNSNNIGGCVNCDFVGPC